jgi:hypothetical protein
MSVGQSLSFLRRCLCALLFWCSTRISSDWKNLEHSTQYKCETFSSPASSRALRNSLLLARSAWIWSKSRILVFVFPPRRPIPLHEAALPFRLAFLPMRILLWVLVVGSNMCDVVSLAWQNTVRAPSSWRRAFCCCLFVCGKMRCACVLHSGVEFCCDSAHWQSSALKFSVQIFFINWKKLSTVK